MNKIVFKNGKGVTLSDADVDVLSELMKNGVKEYAEITENGKLKWLFNMRDVSYIHSDRK